MNTHEIAWDPHWQYRAQGRARAQAVVGLLWKFLSDPSKEKILKRYCDYQPRQY